MKSHLITATILLLFIYACSSDDTLPKLTGEYLGQAPPGDSAKLFAPGIVSNGMFNRDIAITPDGKEIYYGVVLGRFAYTSILVSKRVEGVWSQPEVAGFANNPQWKTLEPCLSPDGHRFFFFSTRPDSAAGDSVAGDEDIWAMDRTPGGWSEPYNLSEPVNTTDEEYFPSVTNDGTLYFTRQEKGSPIGFIYRSKFIDGKYATPEQLPETVNSGQAQYNAYVAPDESYIIVPTYGREDSYGGTDYYISFKDSTGHWTPSINMGDKVNSAARAEYSPYVSPDGKYFFFMSDRELSQSRLPQKLTVDIINRLYKSPQNGNPDIYWISTDIFDGLREKALRQTEN